jgi:AraC-like DNA-binding protein
MVVKGGCEVVVEVINNKLVRISVKDEGIGIATKKLPHVFNPFYDEDEVHLRLYQSTSIGLYLVKSYLQLIHGEISVQSVKERGSTFILELPIYANPYKIPFEAFELLKKNTNLLELAQQRIYEFETSEVLDADIYDSAENELFLIFSESKEDKSLLEPLITGKLKKMFVADKSQCSIRAINHVPDCIIYFITEDYNSDFEIIRFLKRNKITSHIPIVVIIPNEQSTQIKLLAKSNYVHDCIAKDEVEVLINKSIENIFYNKKLQYEFVNTQSKSYSSNESDGSYDIAFIQKINLLIEENLESEELNSDFFVNNMFQSRTQIHRKLKALTNLSLSRYVRVHKLKLAKYYLETKQGNVSEAAFKFGFNSISYFSKSYKEEYGYSPSETFE